MTAVANPAAPAQSALLNLTPPAAGSDWNWSWSEAQWEHKAFQYFAPKKLLAIPQATYSEDYNQSTGQYTWHYLSKLNVIDVDDATFEAASAQQHDAHVCFSARAERNESARALDELGVPHERAHLARHHGARDELAVLARDPWGEQGLRS